MDSDLLETMKVDLRAKYLKDRDDLQRQVGNDPDMWADDKLFETAQKLSTIDELLKRTENLTLSAVVDGSTSSGGRINDRISDRMKDEICCPVCMEEMRENIFCCSNSHPVCSNCVKKTVSCPTCRQCFSTVKPVRNRLAESLIAAFMN